MEEGDVGVERVEKGVLSGGEAEEGDGGGRAGTEARVAEGGGDEARGEADEEGAAEGAEVGVGGGGRDEEGEDAQEPWGGLGVARMVLGDVGYVDIGLDPLRRWRPEAARGGEGVEEGALDSISEHFVARQRVEVRF